MRKLALLLLSLALFAAACGSDSPDSSVAVAEGDAQSGFVQPDTRQSGDGQPNAPRIPQIPAEPDVAASAGLSDEAPSSVLSGGSTCGLGEDLVADRIFLDQIPGDGRDRDVPSALEDREHPSFAPPLVDVERILSGGPPPDGIPPVDSPIFQTASTVDWLRCNEPVLSLSINGEARAYPVQIMTWHELVNDTFGDIPVTVSYCPLCNSALAYRRDLGDRTVTFGTSGRLFNSSLVMYDRETESLWTHFNGGAVVGALTGTQLELLPMQTTSWASFLQFNPDGLVLTRETGFDRRYGTNPYEGYDDVTTDPFLFDGDSDPRLAAKQRVVGIRRGGDNAAVVLDNLAELSVIRTDVAGDTLTVWHLPGTSSALETDAISEGRDIGAVGVYLPIVDGQALTFSRNAGGHFVDAETGSLWNIQGIAFEGPLAGSALTAVEHLDTFWFALAAFEPDTRVITASS